MKKLLMALALLPLMAAAETEVVDGIEWTYTVRDGKAEVGGGFLPAIPSATTGALTIPSTFSGHPVTSIGYNAFNSCGGLTSVTIPEGVTSVGEYAFGYCDGLKSVVIPMGVQSIGDYAFFVCSALGEGVMIPESVQTIGRQAFARCDRLLRIVVDESNMCYCSVDGVLYDKEKTVLISCPGAKSSISIPSGVLKIEEGAFEGCGKLLSVMIPESVREIGADAFIRCNNLKRIEVASTNPYFKSAEGILFDKAMSERVSCPGGLDSVVIPYGVTKLAETAFMRCESLVEVSIPSTVRSIGGRAFNGCTKLKSVTIPASVEEICGLAFNRIENLMLKFEGAPPSGWPYCELTRTPNLQIVFNVGYTDKWMPLFQKSGFTNFKSYDSGLNFQILPGEAISVDTGLIGYTAKGLPSGLKYDKKTGRITGAATKSTAAEGVIVKFTKSGAETEEMTIVVGPVPKIGVALEGDTDGCKVTGAGAYLVGKKVTLKVTTKKGTAFVGFFKDGEPWPNEADSKKTSLAYTMGKEDVSLVAKFEKEKMSVGCVGLSCRSFTAGVAGSPEGIPLEIETQSGIKSVKVEKLPAGMKYDAKKERITGAPTKAGDNTVVITVTAVSGAVEKKEITVPVAAMSETAVGTFNGFVANGEQRIGTFTLTATDAGKLTAKVITAGGTVSFSGTCWGSLEDGVCKVTLTTKKGDFMTLSLDSGAAWDANQLTGTYSPPNMTGWFDLSAQRNAFGKTWYFTAAGDEQTGWTFAYTKDSKAAALTVTLKADGSTAIAGKLGAIKVGASGYANAGGMRDGAIIADFAPIVTVNKVKRALSIRTNLWFDRSNDHAEGAGGANLAE